MYTYTQIRKSKKVSQSSVKDRELEQREKEFQRERSMGKDSEI